MAFTAVLGGFLANLSLAARPALIAMVASGAVLAFLLNRLGGAGQKCAANPGFAPRDVLPVVVPPIRLSAHWLPPILKTRRAILGWVAFLAVIVLVYAPTAVTTMYPLMPGNQQPGTALYSIAMTLGERVDWVGGFFLNTNVVPLVVPALLLAWAARDRLTAAFLAAALVTTAALVKAFSIADYWDLFRYSHAALFAASLFACAPLSPRRSARERRQTAAGAGDSPSPLAPAFSCY